MKKIYLFSLLVLLAGCSQIPVYQHQYQSIEKIDSWILYGRLVLRSEKGGGSTVFYWSQDRDDYLMRFILPLGQGSHVLRGTKDQGVTLMTADSQMFSADNVNDLLSQSLGWHIPLASFRYWVRGIPDPNILTITKQLDAQGRITTIQQGDWNVSIKRYKTVNDIYLPEKIFIEGNQLVLKLVVRRWDIQS